MFRFDHSVNMPSKIGIFMGRITTFRRVRKYHPLLNPYDWNDCLSVETTKTEKVVTLWAYVGQEERLMVTMTDEQKGLFSAIMIVSRSLTHCEQEIPDLYRWRDELRITQCCFLCGNMV